MQKSSFFNSVSGDRKYAAEDWAAYFSSFVSNGVFALPSNSLQVVISSGMGIAIKVGSGFINGYYYRNTTDLAKTLAVADGIYNRIDRIVLRWSLLNRTMTVEVLQGTPASTPTAKALTRDVEVYELALADVYIGAGVTSILQSNITDRRASSELCGFVTGVIDQFDFTTLCVQFDAFFAEYEQRIADEFDYFEGLGQSRYDALDASMDAFEESAQANFTEWFENLEYVLDGDVAGHLQNEIDAMTDYVEDAVDRLEQEMEETIEEVRLTGFSTYIHSKTSTTHALVLLGGGSNIKFVATAAFAKNDTFTINGRSVSVLLPNGEAPGDNFFVNGSVVIGLLEGNTLFLVGGGGGVQAHANLTTAGWTASGEGWEQTASASGVTSDNNVVVSPAPGYFDDYGNCGVRCTHQYAGQLKFYAASKPESAIGVNILIVG